MRGTLWIRWALGLTAMLLLACGVAWVFGRMHGGKSIHFWLDDANGIEPGTIVLLSGVRAGVVTGMALDADPAREGQPRARVNVRLTPEAAGLVGPEQWEVAVTTSPLPGFKAEVALVRHEGGPLDAFTDGAWHSDTHSAVAKQVSQAFDALLFKLRELSGRRDETGDMSLRELFPGTDPNAGDGEQALVSWMLNREQVAHLTAILQNLDALTGEAVESQRRGGLAHVALGSEAHANLMRATADLAHTAGRLRADFERDGALLRLMFTDEECQKIADLVANMELIGRRINAIDLEPVHGGMRSLEQARTALDQVTRIVGKMTAESAGGAPGDLEAQLTRLPKQLRDIYDSVEKTTLASEEIMDQTTEVLRKANQTLSSLNQLLTGLKRSWFFRGAFSESLQYEDLAPFLVPSPGGVQPGPDFPLPFDSGGDQ